MRIALGSCKSKTKQQVSTTLALILLVSATGMASAPPEVVNYVDLSRYVGTWHEIAKIPNRFQDHCAYNTTATYEMLPDGRLSVLNQCANEAGELDRADGIARVVDEATNAKLEVSFVSLLGWHLFWGDYWVIGLDEDYEWVVVGHPDREYGWVLARQPRLSEATHREVFKLIERHGYDADAFVASSHR